MYSASKHSICRYQNINIRFFYSLIQQCTCTSLYFFLPILLGNQALYCARELTDVKKDESPLVTWLKQVVIYQQ